MTGPYRPAGALCLRCGYRPARPHPQAPTLATGWCSDRCRIAWHNQQTRVRQAAVAERVRALLGLPGGRGAQFTLPELEAVLRRLQRVLPAGGLCRYPATTDKHRRPRTAKR